MEIYFATSNKGKVQSLQNDLSKYGVCVLQKNIDLIEPRSFDVQEIAKSKIQQAYETIQKPTIVVDAGLYIDSLNGFPGAFVNFALKTVGLDGLLKLVENKERNCEFRECLAYQDEMLNEPVYFLSQVRGRLAECQKGVMRSQLWSELGKIFIPDGSTKTQAEMSEEEYSEWRKISREKTSIGTKIGSWLIENRNQ